MTFKGVITALITPFYQGEVDKKSLIQLVRQQLNDQVDGLVINGTTGESPTLSENEVFQIVDWVQQEVSGQIPLILGIGHNNTKQAVINIQKAEKLNMDGALAVVPYYNKPSQEGLKKHFQKIAHESSLPVILYNVPSRSQVGLDIATVLELSKEKKIQAIKEASGNMNYIAQLISENQSENFCFLSGDDLSFLDFLQKGGHGVVSVSSHFLLKQMKQALKNLNTHSMIFKKKYQDIIHLLYQVSNPMMIKQVMYFKQIIRSPELRLPLCEPEPLLCQKMKALLKSLDLL